MISTGPTRSGSRSKKEQVCPPTPSPVWKQIFVLGVKRRWRHGSSAGYRHGRIGFSFAPTQSEKKARSRCTARACRRNSTGAAYDKWTAMPGAAAIVLRASLVPSAVRTFIMDGIRYNDKIPNNVNLSDDRALQRALEHWLPNYLKWWREMGPEDSLEPQVYLRTAISVDPSGWADFDYVKMPDYSR